MFLCFMIKNPNNYKLSSLSSFFGCEKDGFYRFANNDTFDWRKILYHLTIQIWNKVRVRSDHKESPVEARVSEYKQSKIHMMIVMITRAIRKGVRFDYVLADSWFTCSEVIRFIRSRHIKCHYLGMIKIGEKGKTKYGFDKKELTAPALIKLLEAKGERRYSRRLGCYLSADVIFADTKVRHFFVKRNKRGPWNGLIIALQYNILSLAKRFSSYETIGGIFRDIQRKTIELSVTDRIWGIILELVTIIAEIFSIEDQDIFDAVINRSDELAHFIDYYKLKTTS